MSPATLKQYRDKAAERQKRWREAQKAKGLNRVSIWLDQDAERILHNATIDQGEAKAAAMTALITRLLQESQNVTHNDARIESQEAELFRQAQRAKLAEQRLMEQVTESERHRHQALELAEQNGRLISEVTELKRRISEIEGQGKAAPAKRPKSQQGPAQAEVSDLPPALFGTDRNAKKAALLEVATTVEKQGGTFTGLAQRLNAAGVPMLKGTGRWNTKNLFQAVDRIRKESAGK